MDNYLSLSKRFSFGKLTFCYVDTSAYFADDIFCSHEIPVKFLRNYKKDDTDYEIVICQIKKKHKEEFLKCLEELKNKMLICGHPDYNEFCEKLINDLKSASNTI